MICKVDFTKYVRWFEQTSTLLQGFGVGFKRVGIESKYENTSKIAKGVSCLLVACNGIC